MADYEGYLLLHDIGCYADPFYFELEGGFLQYFTRKNGKWMGEFSLTRHRVVARPLAGARSPNRFTVELCPVRSVHDTERSMAHFKRTTLILSASTPELADQWLGAFHLWRRRNWKETMYIGADEEELRALRSMLQHYRLELKLTRHMNLALKPVELAPQHDPTNEQQKTTASAAASALTTAKEQQQNKRTILRNASKTSSFTARLSDWNRYKTTQAC